MKKINHNIVEVLVFTFVFLLILAAVIKAFAGEQEQKNNLENTITYENNSANIVEKEPANPFNISNLKELISELDIKFEEIVLAQAYLESGNFTSRIFRENNNMFGMKCARKRMTTHQGEQYGHAYFDTWEDCVLDYAYFQHTYAWNITTEKEYFQYLADNYAEDSLYVYKLKSIIRTKL